jgi:hypothetical protein
LVAAAVAVMATELTNAAQAAAQANTLNKVFI